MSRPGFFVTLALLANLAGSPAAVCGPKEHDWQTGKVLDAQRSRYFAGTVGNSNTNGTVNVNGNSGSYEGQTNGSERAVYRVYETFLIEGDQYAYLAQERMHWRWSKPANVTVNAPVKYAVEKRKLFVLDDDGKEHEMEIIKKTLKLPDQTAR